MLKGQTSPVTDTAGVLPGAAAPTSEPPGSYSGRSGTHWPFPDSRTPVPLLPRKHVQPVHQVKSIKEGQESMGKCSSFPFTGRDDSEGSSTLSSSRTEPQLPTAEIYILTHLSRVFSYSMPHSHSLTRASWGHSPIRWSVPKCLSQAMLLGKHRPRHAPKVSEENDKTKEILKKKYIQNERNSTFNDVSVKGSSAPPAHHLKFRT